MAASRRPVFHPSATLRLAATYLAIIMLMSVGFSVVFYYASSQQLGRELPPPSLFQPALPGDAGNGQQPPADLDRFLQQRIQDGRHQLMLRLVGLDLLALLLGSALAYYLARRSLAPIEAAMEAQSRFVSDASHELRTPLTSLRVTNEVALRNAKLTLTEARELIGHNVEATAKLKELSDNLLDLLKRDQPERPAGPASLQEAAAEAMNRVVGIAVEKRISIEDLVADIGAACDPANLARIVTILLDNAVKYSPANGKIRMEAESRGRFAYLRVHDSGIGIAEGELPHIFERLYRSDKARGAEGFGLGLAIAKELAEGCGGSIAVQSSLGIGSTFTVKLPLGRLKPDLNRAR